MPQFKLAATCEGFQLDVHDHLLPGQPSATSRLGWIISRSRQGTERLSGRDRHVDRRLGDLVGSGSWDQIEPLWLRVSVRSKNQQLYAGDPVGSDER